MGSIAILSVFISMFIFGFLLYIGSFLYSYFNSRDGRNFLFRDYYECGFKSIPDNRNLVDIQFTALGLIFLIYEMEVVLFVPVFLNLYAYSFNLLFSIMFFLFVLILSFWYE